MHVDIIGTLMWFMIPPILNSCPCLKQEARMLCTSHSASLRKLGIKFFLPRWQQAQTSKSIRKVRFKGIRHTQIMHEKVNAHNQNRNLPPHCPAILRPPSWTVGSPAAEKAAQMAYFVSWRLYASTTWDTCWAVDTWSFQRTSYSISWILQVRRFRKSLRAQRRFGQFSLVNRICLDESLGWIEESILYHHDCHGFWHKHFTNCVKSPRFQISHFSGLCNFGLVGLKIEAYLQVRIEFHIFLSTGLKTNP